MKLKELSAEQRRIAVDIIQLYQHFLDLRQEYQEFRGGLHWKQVGSKEYLVKTLDREGHQQSLGPRSPKTEQLLRRFADRKRELREEIKNLEDELTTRAKFCVAAGVNRVPRIAADIVRLLDSKGVLGTHLVVLGSHAIYGYEMAAGVQLKAGLLQTNDLDTLLDTKADLEIAGDVRNAGLLGLIQRIDKSFRLARQRSFRAVNSKGFMVDLIRAPLSDHGRATSLGRNEDLVAEPLQGLDWLADAPRMTQIVIAEDGYPVRFIVPDPRVFALHKIWLSTHPTRDPLKGRRDFHQGEAVASLALEYLNLSFDDDAINKLPSELTSMRAGLIERLRSRRSALGQEAESSLPPGFGDIDEEPTESSTEKPIESVGAGSTLNERDRQDFQARNDLLSRIQPPWPGGYCPIPDRTGRSIGKARSQRTTAPPASFERGASAKSSGPVHRTQDERLSFEDISDALVTDYEINNLRSLHPVMLSLKHLRARLLSNAPSISRPTRSRNTLPAVNARARQTNVQTRRRIGAASLRPSGGSGGGRHSATRARRLGVHRQSVACPRTAAAWSSRSKRPRADRGPRTRYHPLPLDRPTEFRFE